MNNLYITADQIGIETGGGSVTKHESDALRSLGDCEVWGREQIDKFGRHSSNQEEPWKWDNFANHHLLVDFKNEYPKLAHVYAGTFTDTIGWLQHKGCKVSYTAAAHDVTKSRQEHEKLGVEYNYPHLTDPNLFKRYLGGYAAADVLICPSKHSADVMRGFGCTNRIEIIPHGVDLPKCSKCKGTGWYEHSYEDMDGISTQGGGCSICQATGIASIKPFPDQFRVGYLGSYGPDKGVIYLLQAWKKLNYKDAVLVLAGRDSISEWTYHLIQQYGSGNICLMGWVKDVADFYDSISCYVQPSVTEGFGIEVLEAISFGRTVICSRGAGAVDVIPKMLGQDYDPFDVNGLADRIDNLKKSRLYELHASYAREKAKEYTWDKVKNLYIKVWKELLNK